MKKDILAAAFILSLFLLVLKIVPYHGDFPLNDDWNYSYSVEQIFKTGSLRLGDMGAPNLVLQVWWGWLISRIRDGFFNFEALRLSTVLLSIPGLLAFYALLRRIGYGVKLSMLGVLTLMFNPIWFVSTYSFMTEVPYLSLNILSILFYYSGIKSDSNKYLLFFLGSVFASMTFLVRQLGIIVPFCMIVYLSLIKKELNARSLAAIAAVPVIVFASHWYWLNYMHGLTWAHITGRSVRMSFFPFINKLTASAFYFGLFILPFSALLFVVNKGKVNLAGIADKLVMSNLATLLAVYFFVKGPVFYIRNVINSTGLGPVFLHGAAYKSYAFSGPFLSGFLLLLGGLSFYYLADGILRERRNIGPIVAAIGFPVMVFIAQFSTALVYFTFYDRYLLIMLPGLIILGAELIKTKKINIPLQAVPLCVMAAFSMLGTADYLSWNRAKWESGVLAIEKGYRPDQIDNGLEWNGWFTFQRNMAALKSRKDPKLIGVWEWEDMNDYRVILSFADKLKSKDYELSSKYEYKTPFSSSPSYIYTWEYKPASKRSSSETQSN